MQGELHQEKLGFRIGLGMVFLDQVKQSRYANQGLAIIAVRGIIEQVDGLNKSEFKVAALKGSTSQLVVEKAAPNATLVKANSYDEAVNLLLQDKIDVLVADYPSCAVSAFRFQEKGLIAGQAPITFEPLGIALPEDTLLINLVENLLKMLEGTGALKQLTVRWFKSASWIAELE